MSNYYIGDACKYQFTAKKQPELCPDCGKDAVREANECEQEMYIKLLQELKREEMNN